MHRCVVVAVAVAAGLFRMGPDGASAYEFNLGKPVQTKASDHRVRIFL